MGLRSWWKKEQEAARQRDFEWKTDLANDWITYYYHELDWDIRKNVTLEEYRKKMWVKIDKEEWYA